MYVLGGGEELPEEEQRCKREWHLALFTTSEILSAHATSNTTPNA